MPGIELTGKVDVTLMRFLVSSAVICHLVHLLITTDDSFDKTKKHVE